MDTIQEIRRVLEIQLNYIGMNEKSNQKSTSSLAAVRREITLYKNQLRKYTSLSMVLGAVVCFASLATVFGAAWIPWQYVGLLIIVSFGGILQTINIYRKLELVKKRELFLFMLHKMDPPSGN